MSALLRHPATVPALFSRVAEPHPRARGGSTLRCHLARSAPLAMTMAWAAVVLIEVPLVKTAAAAVGLALPR